MSAYDVYEINRLANQNFENTKVYLIGVFAQDDLLDQRQVP